MKNFFLQFSFLVLAGFWSCSVVAALPLYDGFNYPAGAKLAGQTNSEGSVWAAVGTNTASETDQVILTNQSLTTYGLPPSEGNAVMYGGLGWGARIAVGPPVITPTSTNDLTITNGQVFYSLILRIDDLGQNTSAGGFIAGFNNTVGSQGNQPTAVGARLFVRKALNGFNLGVGKAPTNNALQVVWDPAERGFGTNIFVVVGYIFRGPPNSIDDEAVAWIQPDPSTFADTNSPPPQLIAPLNPPAADLPFIRTFLFRQGNAQVPSLLMADELRIGTTWKSVTPPPSLNIARSSPPIVVVSWTTNVAGYDLEATTDLTPPVQWSPVTETIGTEGDHRFATFDGSSGNQYFRLQRIGRGNAPLQSALLGRTITMNNGDTATLLDDTNYSAQLGGVGESGTYVYLPNGNTATLALTPIEGAGSTFTLNFTSDRVSGTYTIEETAQNGTFVVQ